jgi:hypothetical protein
MVRLCCRNLVLSLICPLIMAGLGSSAVDAQSGSSPTVNLRRFVISQNVWPADFNGDGFTDLAGSEEPPSRGGTGRVIVLVGNGAGNFTATNFTSYVGHVLGVGDFNGDGRTDLVVADASHANPAILPGNGNGTFAAPRPVAATTEVTFAVSSDFNGDGKRDLVVGAEGMTVAVYAGAGDFSFGPETTLAVNASPHDGIISDLNGDGKKDLVVANHYAHSVTVLLNQGAMQFSGADVPLSGNGNDVTVADVNRDGNIDLVVATSNGGDGDFWFEEGHAEVLVGAGDGTFAAGASYEVPRGAWQIVVGDFTRDGILDIATANRSSITHDDWCGTFWKTWDTVSVLPGLADGTFGAASSFSLGDQSDPDDDTFKNKVRTLNTADLNRDGATDLIVSWGIVLLNVEADANWPASVDAGPDQQFENAYETVLTARAVDNDQDMLTWTWRDAAGNGLASANWPSICYRGLQKGANVFTVTVDDGHGHQTSDTVTVTVGSGSTGGGSTNPTMTLLAPVEGATIQGGQPYSIKFRIDDPDMALYQWSVVYSVDDGATWEYICRNCGQQSQPGLPTVREDSFVWQNPGPAAGQALVTVFAQQDDDSAIGTASTVRAAIAAQPGNVPYPWQQTDIGAVAKAGSTTFSNGVYTVRASGADIWETADEFRFTYQVIDGPVAVTARVDSVQNVHVWTKAGLMLRAGSGASARHAAVFVTPGKGIAFQRRLTTGGTSITTPGPLATAPVWLKLASQVNYPTETVRAYYRRNLSDPWTLVGEDTFSAVLGQPSVGLALTSHADGTLATAAFSNVSVAPIAEWNAASIGASGGSAAWDDTQVRLKAAGTDIWNTSDQFEYAYQGCFRDCTITARVNSLVNTHQWAKAGVMIRESLLASSKHVDLVTTPGKGVSMQYRSASGGVSAIAGSVAGATPGWVRLKRTGNVFTGFWSTDGVTFTEVGTVTLPMNEGLWIGLAATSHNTAATTTAEFDNITIAQP